MQKIREDIHGLYRILSVQYTKKYVFILWIFVHIIYNITYIPYM
jgi:hypothetical protein